MSAPNVTYAASASRITYVATRTGWGDGMPTGDDCATFCALVEARLRSWYPGHIVEARVDDHALEATVSTDDPEIDERSLCSTIGNDVWADWCAGVRSPS